MERERISYQGEDANSRNQGHAGVPIGNGALMEMAYSLLETVEEETRHLRSGDHVALLQILPRKENLARHVAQKLKDVAKENGNGDSRLPAHKMVELKKVLRRIHVRNELNRKLISESLSVYEGLLRLTDPDTYGPDPHRTFPLLKGRSLSTEA